mmetsp:Transcript_10494/g.23840  ORF Transcript_10494/g.23840 Transcript_10494/m.23840 type:complete len:285 (+) Transcript_10494:62-916(+)|eukprot:CAMPEP_0178423820 /NCGR_PEP_ID=MMETSP0689_2-20121128/27884_1 /TAXON_ID=160604 /ORGANISM="Amphidinium massartii, Strain CS-259" /LENGTH=284 /DNA_ID=CAMNT_0020045423 /DNA_START=59 /DNA_END=913 /DNA_ORIENTATION=+
MAALRAAEEEFYLNEVREDGSRLQHVPLTRRSMQLSVAAVRQTPMAWPFVPDRLKIEVALALVREDGLSLQHLPDELRTRQVVVAASVEQNPLSLQHAAEWLEIAVDDLELDDVLMSAVGLNGLALQYVPDNLIHPLMALEAVGQNGLALKFVPAKCIDRGCRFEEPHVTVDRLMLTAVRQNGLALRHVPAARINRDIALAAVRQNGLALRYVPAALRRDMAVMLAAVQQNGHALQYIERDRQYRNVIEQALWQNDAAVMHVADNHLRHQLLWQPAWRHAAPAA